MAKVSKTSGSANIPLGSWQNTRQSIVYIPAALTADKPGLLFLESIADGAASSDLGGLYLWADNANALHASATYPTDQNGAGTLVASTTAALLGSVATDNNLIRGDGGARGVQTTTITVADTTMNTSGMGTLGCGAITTSGDLTFSNDNPEIIGGDTDGIMYISADTANNQGGTIRLHGNTETDAQDIEFYADTTQVLEWDESEANWDFQSTNVKGLGTVASGTITVSSDLALATGSITSASAAITFDDENLSTTGTCAFSGTVATGALTVTGAASCSTTMTVGTNLTLTAGYLLMADDQQIRLGAQGASDSYIQFDGTNSQMEFFDVDTNTIYTLKQLATGTTLNPLVNGNLTISDGDLDWSNTATSESATWDLDATTVDAIDLISDVTTANVLHIVADSVTTGKVLHIQSDHDDAAGAHIYLDWLESGGNADGRYLVCYDGTGDVLTVKKNGALEIAGDAEGTDAITITDGDITLTDGDLQVVAGYVQADSTDDDTSHFKKNNNGASAVVLDVENTHATGTGYAMSITQAASSGASGGLSISNKGTSPLLYMAAGASRTGYVMHVPMANQLAERALFIDGAITSADNEGTIEVNATGVLAAGANLLRLKSTGNQTAASYLMEIFNAGTPTGATNGTSLYIDDDTGAAATSYAVCIDAVTNEAFRVLAGKSLFDEEAEFDGGINVDADSTLDGKLTITASDAASVDGLVIDQNDTNASKSGILVTFDSDGAGIRVTNEKVDGVCYEGICGVNSTTENMMLLDGGAAARWIGADNAGILKVDTASDFANAGASMLMINRQAGTCQASTEGSCLRIEDATDTGDGYAVQINSAGNLEAINVTAGASLFAEKVTFTAGQQSSSVAVTANATKHTSNAIPDGTTFATVTSSNSGHFVDLPAATPGNVVYIHVAANGYELMTADSDTVYLNNAIASAGDDASSTVAANTTVVAICIDSTHWVAYTLSAAAAYVALESATS